MSLGSEEKHVGDVLRFGPLELNRIGQRVSVSGETISLTHNEHEILHTFLICPGRLLTRAFLLRTVWNASESDFEQGTRNVDMHITRLRTKLGAAGAFIATVRGSGYRFDPPPNGVADRAAAATSSR